jgi:4-amino-4-deoxy-L-arabinose transferase-like glycosyltransferase
MPSPIEALSERLRIVLLRRPLLVLGLVALIAFVPALGWRDWWYPDEPDVALPIIEMHGRGSWVVPSHNGQPWLDYPPLAYWGGLLLAQVQGAVTPFGTRLPMVAYFLALLAATLAIGRHTFDARRAVVAGVALLSMPVLWLSATHLQVDLGFAAAIALGMAAYVAGDAADGGRAWVRRIAAFTAFGVAILGKGPLGALLPGLILTVWHLSHREWWRVVALAPLALVSLAVAAPWYLLLGRELGFEVVGRELYLQNFDRFGQTARGHGGKGFHYYFTSLPPDIGMWILLVVPAFVAGWRRRHERGWRLLALWALLPFLFFTCASTRRNVYLLPILPALALLAADVLAAPASTWLAWWRLRAGQVWMLVLAGLGVALLLAAAVWPWLPSPARATPELMADLRLPSVALGLLLLGGSYWAWRSGAGRPLRRWTLLAGTQLALWSLVMATVLPVIDTERSFAPAGRWLVERVPADQPVGFLVPGREATRRPAWLAHLDGRRLLFFNDAAPAVTWLNESPDHYLLIDPRRVPPLPGTASAAVWSISGDPWQALVAAPTR